MERVGTLRRQTGSTEVLTPSSMTIEMKMAMQP
jgi:hypothetical protein